MTTRKDDDDESEEDEEEEEAEEEARPPCLPPHLLEALRSEVAAVERALGASHPLTGKAHLALARVAETAMAAAVRRWCKMG